MSLLLTGLKRADLIANCVEQRVTHFAHNAIGAALHALMLAVAEINVCTAAQFVGLVGDVTVVPAQLACQEPDAIQSVQICAGPCVAQQSINLVTD